MKLLYRVCSVASLLPVSMLFLAIISLPGCSVMAPKYTQPPAPVPTAWPSGAAYQEKSAKQPDKQLAEIPWRDFFVDKKLAALIELALKNNRDLKVAALNIERSRAQFQIKRADLFPKIEATAAATFQGVPETLSGKGQAITTEQYSVGLGFSSYELDLFGRVRSLKDIALEQYLATEQAQLAVQISLVSQVAAAYLALAADRERLQLAKETLKNQEDSFSLTKSRYDAGISTALALNQAQSTVYAARVDIARYTTLVAQDQNALLLTVGSVVPDDLLPMNLSESLTVLKEITPGLPSDVLLNRPDIIQAESLLKGANANIGAARAAFFPRISLVTSIGFGSDDLAALMKPGAFAWKFAPQISLPLFDGGTNKSNQKVAEIDRDIAVTQYEKAIQTAFREVSDALAQMGTIGEQMAAQQSLTDSASESYQLSQARFEKGVDNYLQVLDSQRSLYAARQNLIAVRLVRSSNLVTLYKVLGGGSH